MVRPGLRWRFTLACGLTPFQGLFVCFDLVTGVALALHPGLYSTSPFRACSFVTWLRNGGSVGTAPLPITHYPNIVAP